MCWSLMKKSKHFSPGLMAFVYSFLRPVLSKGPAACLGNAANPPDSGRAFAVFLPAGLYQEHILNPAPTRPDALQGVRAFYPSATSNIIMMIKPAIRPSVAT